MKRCARILVGLGIVLALAPPCIAAPSDGDFDGDGKVNVRDAILALRSIVGLRVPTAGETSRADVAPLVDGVPAPDGRIDFQDVGILLARALGLIDLTEETLKAPPVLASRSTTPGIVEVDIAAEPARLSLIPGKTTAVYAYNGTLPGPTLEAREGDRVIVHFTNRLPEPTTIHWHGLHIPADQDGNPWSPVAPGGSVDYVFTIPVGSAGTYWYHPHPHGTTAAQVAKGLAGAVVIRTDGDPLSFLPEKLLILSDNRFNADGSIAKSTVADLMNGREGDVLFVNGRIRPTLALRNGEAQRWRVVNASSARYYRLAFSDGGSFLHVGSDGGLFERPVEVRDLLLAPAERAEVIVQGRKATGHAILRSLPYDRGAMTMPGASSMPRHGMDGNMDMHRNGGMHGAGGTNDNGGMMPGMGEPSGGMMPGTGELSGGMMPGTGPAMPGTGGIMPRMSGGKPVTGPAPPEDDTQHNGRHSGTPADKDTFPSGNGNGGVRMPGAGDPSSDRGGMHEGSDIPGGIMGGMDGMNAMPLDLLIVRYTGGAASPLPVIPATLRPVPTPIESSASVTRDLVLTEDMMALKFFINGKNFDPDRVDLEARLGAAEIWRIVNRGDMDHPIHLHGFSFRVLDRGGVPEPFPAWKDTVNVPKGETVRFLVEYTDYAGKRPFHCHILEHEDLGMMGVLDVRDTR